MQPMQRIAIAVARMRQEGSSSTLVEGVKSFVAKVSRAGSILPVTEFACKGSAANPSEMIRP